MKLDNILTKLVFLAKKSNVNQKHSAVVLYKGIPVSYAVNSNDEHAEYAALKSYQRFAVKKGWCQKRGLREPKV